MPHNLVDVFTHLGSVDFFGRRFLGVCIPITNSRLPIANAISWQNPTIHWDFIEATSCLYRRPPMRGVLDHN
ncbi:MULTISPECIES: hypothetical protein [Aerosakkonema]|uniref:hypothetical protein n=1 Tax=Aerosakkonema TaxID=1246629 RepID=UPI0035BAA4DD